MIHLMLGEFNMAKFCMALLLLLTGSFSQLGVAADNEAAFHQQLNTMFEFKQFVFLVHLIIVMYRSLLL